MGLEYNWSILRCVPDQGRGEAFNLGIVVFLGDRLDVRIHFDSKRKRIASEFFEVPQSEEIIETLNFWFDKNESVYEQYNSLKSIGQFHCSALGSLKLDYNNNYEEKLESLLREFVYPYKRPIFKEKNTTLHSNIKNLFARNNLVGISREDINRHMIVPKYPINLSNNIKADFAFKNGVYHIIESIDFAVGDTAQKFREASLKAITLDQASKSFGKETKRYIAFNGLEDITDYDTHLNLLHEYSDTFYDLRDNNNLILMLDHFKSLASPEYNLPI